jgi:hypothetical protein
MAQRLRGLRRAHTPFGRNGAAQLDTSSGEPVYIGRVLVTLLSLLLVSLPTAEGQASNPLPPGPGSVSGRVTVGATTRPLPDAVVTLTSLQGRATVSTLTDENGRYTFESVPLGTYILLVTHAGFAANDRFPVQVTATQPHEHVNLGMSAGGSLQGRVTTANGQPLRDATVRAIRMTEDGNGFTVTERNTVRTNAAGEFALSGLATGMYRVSAEWIDPDRLKARAGPGLGQTYFPGTNVPSEAVPFRVSAGSVTRGIDITLPAEDLFRVTGHFLRGPGEGRIEAHLLSDEWTVRTVEVREGGAFSVTHLKPGRHVLWARASTPDGFEAAWTFVDLGTDLTGLALPMVPTGSVRGRVVTEEGAVFGGNGMQVIGEWVDANGTTRLDAIPRDRVDIEEDGRFELGGLFGHRRLKLNGNDWVVARLLIDKNPADVLLFDQGQQIDDVLVVVRLRKP